MPCFCKYLYIIYTSLCVRLFKCEWEMTKGWMDGWMDGLLRDKVVDGNKVGAWR